MVSPVTIDRGEPARVGCGWRTCMTAALADVRPDAPSPVRTSPSAPSGPAGVPEPTAPPSFGVGRQRSPGRSPWIHGKSVPLPTDPAPRILGAAPGVIHHSRSSRPGRRSYPCRSRTALRRGTAPGHGCLPWPPLRSCSPRSPGRRWPMMGTRSWATARVRPTSATAGSRPRLTRPTSVIRFSVTYRNGAGAAPGFVRVLIDGRPRAMAAPVGRRVPARASASRMPPGSRPGATGSGSRPARSDGTTAALGAGWVPRRGEGQRRRVVVRATGRREQRGGTSAVAGGGSTAAPSDATGG